MIEARLPVIPEFITVHLGRPTTNAQNVQVSFADYIKNVASSEIYPTWPETSLRANIYAQISFALNRIYTEWYRSQGYNFDITNSTQFDQAFEPGREIFANISKIVDDIFNNYVSRQGSVEPYFTEFCNGTTSKCAGLSQWGTVDLANKGYTPYAILQNYYGDDINIIRDAPVQNIKESYPNTPIKVGDISNEVKVIQLQLNRIAKNFPAIPKISITDGAFGVETENAVKEFQRTFNLTPDGIVGKSTWYKIKNIYNNVKRLAELSSEGVRLEEVTNIYPNVLKQGSKGDGVGVVQYYLNVIGYFNPIIPLIAIDGDFGTSTVNAVKSFQQFFGLTPDGIVGVQTWEKMQEIYDALIKSLPLGYEGGRGEIYPGYVLKKGMRDDNIKDLQKYLQLIAQYDKEIPIVQVTGYFGDTTYNAVKKFQKKYGLQISGFVGPLTWNKIAQTYDNFKGLDS